jgi:hypothetical protein
VPSDEGGSSTRKWERSWIGGITAAAIVVLVLGLAVRGRDWPFDSYPRTIEHFESPSVWQYLFSERFTLGYVRLAIVFASLFLVASVTALAVSGRWMSGFGGLSVDEKESAEDHISALEEQLTETQAKLVEELQKRQEAEDWASDLIDELDQAQIQLDEVKEELETHGDGTDPGRDSGPAG